MHRGVCTNTPLLWSAMYGHYISQKPQVEKVIRSGVVYEIMCPPAMPTMLDNNRFVKMLLLDLRP